MEEHSFGVVLGKQLASHVESWALPSLGGCLQLRSDLFLFKSILFQAINVI